MLFRSSQGGRKAKPGQEKQIPFVFFERLVAIHKSAPKIDIESGLNAKEALIYRKLLQLARAAEIMRRATARTSLSA